MPLLLSVTSESEKLPGSVILNSSWLSFVVSLSLLVTLSTLNYESTARGIVFCFESISLFSFKLNFDQKLQVSSQENETLTISTFNDLYVFLFYSCCFQSSYAIHDQYTYNQFRYLLFCPSQ